MEGNQQDPRLRRQRARQLKATLVAAYSESHRRSEAPATESNTSSASVDVVDWITEDPALLWEPFGAGSTLMHWAAQHLRYEQINHRAKIPQLWQSARNNDSVVIADPWEWLLGLAADVDSTMLVKQRDGGGESCLDCFMSAWQHGSRHQDPYRLGAAVDAVRQKAPLLDQLQGMVRRCENAGATASSTPSVRAGDRRVVLVFNVWQAWKRLCRAAQAPGESLIAFMARTGRALDSFAWLAVTLCPLECQVPTEGAWPLHLWASSPRPPTEELDALGLQLLHAYPNAVEFTDQDGRLPLHRALTRANKPLRQCQELALACPATLGLADPVEGIYPFAMAASVMRLEVRAVMRTTQRRHPSQRLYDWLDMCRRDMDTYEQEVSTHLLGHVYVMLRALPQALEYSRQVPAKQEREAEGDGEPTPCQSSAGTTVKEAYAKVLHDLV